MKLFGCSSLYFRREMAETWLETANSVRWRIIRQFLSDCLFSDQQYLFLLSLSLSLQCKFTPPRMHDFSHVSSVPNMRVRHSGFRKRAKGVPTHETDVSRRKKKKKKLWLMFQRARSFRHLRFNVYLISRICTRVSVCVWERERENYIRAICTWFSNRLQLRLGFRCV